MAWTAPGDRLVMVGGELLTVKLTVMFCVLLAAETPFATTTILPA